MPLILNSINRFVSYDLNVSIEITSYRVRELLNGYSVSLPKFIICILLGQLACTCFRVC